MKSPVPTLSDRRLRTLRDFKGAIAALLIAAAWPGLWWWALYSPRRHTPAARTAPSRTPVIRYIQGESAEGQTFWSPLLFSLPTRYGFSRIVRMDWMETRGMPGIPPPRPLLTEFTPDKFPLPAAPPALTDPSAPPREISVPYLSPLSVPSPDITANREPVWTAAGKLAAAEFELPDNWREALPETGLHWSVTALVEIGEDGRVRHVFISAPHENKALNTAVAGVLRRGRAAAAAATRWGPVTVFKP